MLATLSYDKVQLALNNLEVDLAKTIGLTIISNGNSIWSCPNRPTFPVYEPSYPQWSTARTLTRHWCRNFQSSGRLPEGTGD
jgi:hypothetical protein